MAKDELAEKVSISLPPTILSEIDQIAKDWFTSRSGVLIRMYLEWKRANMQQLTLTETPEIEKAR